MGGGLITHKFTVSVVVGRSAERTAQFLLDGYLSYKGATSIRQAIESDRTLGGVVQDLIVESANNISTLEANDATYLAIDFVVTVYA
jgi:hypothetical protein